MLSSGRVLTIIGAGGIIAGSLALAHDGVKNAAVMARMHGMSEIAAQMKAIGDMAKGETTFDAAQARAAVASIAEHAGAVPGLFEAPETDPKSEALPVIWEKFGDFTGKALDLQVIHGWPQITGSSDGGRKPLGNDLKIQRFPGEIAKLLPN
ncbi:MAG: cytochrome c, partial [Pseudomonadota bacterium]